MSKHSGSGRIGSATRTSRTKKPVSFLPRRLGFESLENRRLLSTVTAPTSIVFQPQTGQGTATLTSANNSSTSRELQFLVSGVTAGNTVNVYVDGGTTVIGTGTVASGATTITVNTDGDPHGATMLSNGTHSFTATQTDTTGDPASASSPSTQVQVFGILTLTSIRAAAPPVGQVFTYTVQTNVPSGDTVTVAQGTSPTGMTFNAATETFTWTPAADQAGTSPSFTVTLTDTIGNTATVPVFVAVPATSGISVIAPPASIAIGSPVLVALNSADSGTPNFSVTTSNSSDPSVSGDLTATLMPQTNQVLQIVTNEGDVDIQLLDNYTPNTVAHLVSLINSGVYTNTSFYRIIAGFMSQGGVAASGAGSSIPVELNPDLRFTSTGLLAMANDGVDGNSSEFFITDPSTSNVTNGDGSTTYADMGDGFLDFRYTIFGKLISGDNVRQAIAATPVEEESLGAADSQPVTPITIESMSIITETNDSVLMLKALTGATGTYTVNITDAQHSTQSFTITVATNSYDPPNPWVNPINGTDTISTPVNTAVNFTPSPGEAATAPGASAPQVDVQLFRPVPSIPNAYVDNSYVASGGGPAVAANSDVTLTQNGSSYTLTPTNGYQGVQFLEVTAVTPISGKVELQVGSATTGPINFDSTNLAATALNIQDALQQLTGLSKTTVTAVAPIPTLSPTDFNFDVTFASSESPITDVTAST
ncbi:MAG: peptidylprolyl isomerase, partial [Thermoguttaceae bacterium]